MTDLNRSVTLMSIRDITETLQRSRASVYRDIKNGDFPKPMKIGGSSRWHPSQVEGFIEARLQAG